MTTDERHDMAERILITGQRVARFGAQMEVREFHPDTISGFLESQINALKAMQREALASVRVQADEAVD